MVFSILRHARRWPLFKKHGKVQTLCENSRVLGLLKNLYGCVKMLYFLPETGLGMGLGLGKPKQIFVFGSV
jgi:hypothetical protein